jgi:hypothetical protein
MNIRWYKDGKLDKAFHMDHDVSGIEVGSIIDLPRSVLRYGDVDEDHLHFDLDLWTVSDHKNNNLIVIKKLFIETEFYTGYIVKVDGRWPWYQMVNAKLSDI